MDNEPRKELQFFKCISSEACRHRLLIPLAYSQYKQGKLPNNALLRDRYGNIWPVEVEKHGNGFFFEKGWTKFVEDNSVEIGDFLVFQYDGSSVFQTILLGRTECEKVGFEALNFNIKAEEDEIEDEEEAVEVEAEDEEEETLDANSGDSPLNDSDEDYIYKEEEEEEEQESLDINNGDVLENGAREANIDEEEEEERKEKSSSHGSSMKFSGDINFKVVKDKRDNNRREDSYGAEIFKSGLISPPKNPYFVTRTRRKRRDELYVPVDVVKDYNLDLPSETILHDSSGRKWPTKLTAWQDGRLWYCGGWARLCRVNLVTEDDRCICEFVKGKSKQNLSIQVHIVRAGVGSKLQRK